MSQVRKKSPLQYLLQVEPLNFSQKTGRSTDYLLKRRSNKHTLIVVPEHWRQHASRGWLTTTWPVCRTGAGVCQSGKSHSSNFSHWITPPSVRCAGHLFLRQHGSSMPRTTSMKSRKTQPCVRDPVPWKRTAHAAGVSWWWYSDTTCSSSSHMSTPSARWSR